MGISPRFAAGRASILVLSLALGLGCVAITPTPSEYGYFRPPPASDPWTPKISGWQSRERTVTDTEALRGPASVSGSGAAATPSAEAPDLRAKYFSYRSDRKREMARNLAAWIQREARDHYRADGPFDHWATLEETLDGNGDDCDGLELLVYHFLRDLGFREEEVYRAIVHRPSDGQHHMVTLWFEDRDDPWVIDPTGAMTTGMPRMSEIPGWVPLKVFSETEEFTVKPTAF